jgi:outer membrane scaffolding protein for murein synthesis (MipA/OmpV family)
MIQNICAEPLATSFGGGRAGAWRGAAVVAVGLLIAGTAVHAQAEPEPSVSDRQSGGFVGLGLRTAPRYQGANEVKTSGIPAFSYQWSHGFFVGGQDGLLGYQSKATDHLRLGVALGMDEGRSASDSRDLAGMGDISARPTLNLHAKMTVAERLEVSVSTHMGSGSDSKGGVVQLGASYGIPLNATTRVRLDVKATWANSDYMQDYFGVNPSQSAVTGYKLYTPGAGLRDVTVGVGVQHPLSTQWTLLGGLSHTTLSDAANASPLTRNSTYQSAFAAIAYRF